jgi:hypothetical protein
MRRILSDLRVRRTKAEGAPRARDKAEESQQAKPDRGREARLRDLLWVDSDLKEGEEAVDAANEQLFAVTEAPGDLQTVVELLRDVAKTEFDREMNLNTRAAAVAAVAGLIVTASGAVGKTVFETTELSGTDRDVAVALIVVGLVALVAAMFMVVMVVLRPKQAKTRQTFLTDALVGVWTTGGPSIIVSAQKDRLNEVAADRLLRTIALWSVRNRQKARWLRRAWVFLALGIFLIGIAGLLVVSAVLDYSFAKTFAMVALGLAVVWLVLIVDPFQTGRRASEQEEKRRREELETIASRLARQPRQTPAGGRSGGEPGKARSDMP